jgi:hypothetical protein
MVDVIDQNGSLPVVANLGSDQTGRGITSRPADDLPEVTDLQLSPVIAGPDGVAVGNAGSSDAIRAEGPVAAQIALMCTAG